MSGSDQTPRRRLSEASRKRILEGLSNVGVPENNVPQVTAVNVRDTDIRLSAIRGAADEMIVKLNELTGLDFETGRDEILEMISIRLNGNWDVSASFENGLPDIRMVHEAEFDQYPERFSELEDSSDFSFDGSLVWVSRDAPRLEP